MFFIDDLMDYFKNINSQSIIIIIVVVLIVLAIGIPSIESLTSEPTLAEKFILNTCKSDIYLSHIDVLLNGIVTAVFLKNLDRTVAVTTQIIKLSDLMNSNSMLVANFQDNTLAEIHVDVTQVSKTTSRTGTKYEFKTKPKVNIPSMAPCMIKTPLPTTTTTTTPTITQNQTVTAGSGTTIGTISLPTTNQTVTVGNVTGTISLPTTMTPEMISAKCNMDIMDYRKFAEYLNGDVREKTMILSDGSFVNSIMKYDYPTIKCLADNLYGSPQASITKRCMPPTEFSQILLLVDNIDRIIDAYFNDPAKLSKLMVIMESFERDCYASQEPQLTPKIKNLLKKIAKSLNNCEIEIMKCRSENEILLESTISDLNSQHAKVMAEYDMATRKTYGDKLNAVNTELATSTAKLSTTTNTLGKLQLELNAANTLKSKLDAETKTAEENLKNEKQIKEELEKQKQGLIIGAVAGPIVTAIVGVIIYNKFFSK